MKTTPRRTAAIIGCACMLLVCNLAQAQLRIVDYNAAIVTNPTPGTARAGMSDVLEAIGIETKNGIGRPIDVLTVQEVNSTLNTGVQSIVNILNTIYGPGTYARSTVAGTSNPSGETQAVIYNTNTVQLTGQVAIGTASLAGAPRAPMRFEFQPVGYDAAAKFYIYSSHYKAGSEATDETRRNIEAQSIRANADLLPADARIIYAGDFNIQSHTEAMYQTLLAAGNGQAVDPINQPGSWNNNASFAPIHTQAPLVNGVNNLTGGGMDDRLDFQLVSSETMSGQGISYIGPGVPNLSGTPTQHSYHAFGNNGTTFNLDINNGANTALPLSEYNPSVAQPTRTEALNALATASDHLPVVADYQLPAKMAVALGSVPTQVIVGSSPTVGASVSNAAPVAVQIGADQLDYTLTGGGAVSGAGAGSLLALAAPAAHVLNLDASTVGPKAGTVSANSTSVAVANGTFNQPVNYTVLDHSAPEFVDNTGIHTLAINFGSLLLGSGTASESFQVENLSGMFRASLDLNSFLESGDPTNRFTTDLTPFSNLAAGTASSFFDVFFATDQLGSFSATYQLFVADQAGIFGGTGQQLQLSVSGMVIVPEPSSVCMLGLAAVGLVGLRLRFVRRRS